MLLSFKLSAQSKVSSLVKKETSVSGGLAISNVFYNARGIDSRRDPYFFSLVGNLTVKVNELVLPFSVTYNLQETKFSRPQPFNKIGVSPTYKWVKGHLGYRSMQFSELTLAGNIFLGVGVELTPDRPNIAVSAMYGQFSRAIIPGKDNSVLASAPAYERWGYGVKTTFKKFNSELDLILFKAEDKASSIPEVVAESLGITPANNLVTGINLRSQLTQSVSLDIQYSISSYTENINDKEKVLESYTYLNNTGGLFVPRESTSINQAVIAKLNYSKNTFQIGGTYREIGPNYKTMGSTFINNDLRDMTLNTAKSFFSNKLQVALNGGVQRNNLNKAKSNQMVRFITGASITYTPSDNFSINTNFSNYTTNTQQTLFSGQTRDNLDSLFYRQVTNSMGFSITYNPKKEVSKSTLLLTCNVQDAKDNTSGTSRFYMASIGDQFQLNKTTTIVLTFNFNKNELSALDSKTMGPALAFSKSLNEKTRVGASSTYQKAYSNTKQESDVYNAAINCSYTPKKAHSFSADCSYLYRKTFLNTAPTFNEWRANINYRYSFASK